MLSSIWISLLAAQPVLCWGDLGHRTVAYLAQKYFTEEGSRFVDSLLANDQGWDISDAAIWPDGSVKRRRPYTAPWHYIDARDNPPLSCGITYKRDCNNNGVPGCIVSAITNMTALVNDPAAVAVDQKEALMFLIHFIGDIHQPLHTEHLQKGGNNIATCFDDHCSRINLHSIWDTSIPHKHRAVPASPDSNTEKAAAAKWAKDLYTSGVNDMTKKEVCDDVQKAQDCALQWAADSNGWVCKYVLAKGEPWLRANDLGGEYYEGAVPIVDEMISKAGARLGAWVNALAAARSSAQLGPGQLEL